MYKLHTAVFVNARKLLINGQSNRRHFDTQINVSRLPNGMRVATKESCCSLTCTSLFIETGSRFENAENNGISHFIEHMAYQGFNSICKNSLQQNLYNNGGKLTARTTREYQVFRAVSLPEYASACVDALMKIVTSLELSEADIELQKTLIIDESIDNENNPKSVVFDYLHQTAFQGTTLEHSVIGPSKNVLKFDSNTIRDYIENNYKPHRLLLVSTGYVSHSANVNQMSCLHNLGLGNSKPLEYGPKRFTGSSIVYRDDSMPYAHVAIAVEAPGYGSPDYLPLSVASCLIDSWDRTQGGRDRHGSPLARAAAMSMHCERFESFYIAYRDIGLWGVYFVGNKLVLDDMVINIQDQWMHICNTTVKTEVQRAVNLAKLKLARRVNGLMNSCNDIGLQLLYTSKWKPLPELYNDLNSVTYRHIREMGHKYIYDKCPVVAAVGPTETLLDYNRVRSGMYWLRF